MTQRSLNGACSTTYRLVPISRIIGSNIRFARLGSRRSNFEMTPPVPVGKPDTGKVLAGSRFGNAMIRMSPQPDTGKVLAGLVERVTYHNVENGFCVLRARARGHHDVVRRLPFPPAARSSIKSQLEPRTTSTSRSALVSARQCASARSPETRCKGW